MSFHRLMIRLVIPTLALFTSFSLAVFYFRLGNAFKVNLQEVDAPLTFRIPSGIPTSNPVTPKIENAVDNSSMLRVFNKSKNHIQYPDEDAPIILPKILVLYFPQFHQDPLNDRLWGTGFTDWDSLREAPNFNRQGHAILRPTATPFGYYDLTNSTIRKLQGELARTYGVDGFVYHHYWFYDDLHPGPSLHAPLMGMLHDGYPDIPFSLNWVPVNWTTTWHRTQGNESSRNTSTPNTTTTPDKLLQQQFFPSFNSSKILDHYQWLRKFFHHKNYIKVQGKPVLMLYRSVPGVHAVIRRLRELAILDGFPGLYCTLGQYATNNDLSARGRNQGVRETLEGENAIFDRLTSYPFPFDWTKRRGFGIPDWCTKHDTAMMNPHPKQEILGVVTSFDNTPRRDFDEARIWMSPDMKPNNGAEQRLKTFVVSMKAVLFYLACCFAEGGVDQFVLINAWNEWGEGMAMEPSNVYGLKFLENLKKVKDSFNKTCRRSL